MFTCNKKKGDWRNSDWNDMVNENKFSFKGFFLFFFIIKVIFPLLGALCQSCDIWTKRFKQEMHSLLYFFVLSFDQNALFLKKISDMTR